MEDELSRMKQSRQGSPLDDLFAKACSDPDFRLRIDPAGACDSAFSDLDEQTQQSIIEGSCDIPAIAAILPECDARSARQGGPSGYAYAGDANYYGGGGGFARSARQYGYGYGGTYYGRRLGDTAKETI